MSAKLQLLISCTKQQIGFFQSLDSMIILKSNENSLNAGIL